MKLQFAPVINVGKNTPQIGLFNFRSFLNIGMLLSESEKAKQVRSLILDIVIATINEKSGGGTKYINRRDANYIPSAVAEINYRKSLTSAINQCVDGHHTMKYAQITDHIYKAVFPCFKRSSSSTNPFVMNSFSVCVAQIRKLVARFEFTR